MTDVIGFLERLGADASVRRAFALGHLQAPQLDEDVQEAILARDEARLRRLLGAVNVCCALMPPREDEPAREEPGREDETIPGTGEEPALNGALRFAG